MMINQLDKQTLKTIRAELDLAMKNIENRYGVVLRTGTCRFTSEAATMKIEIATRGAAGEVVDTELDKVLERGKDITAALADAQRLLQLRARR